MRNIMGSLAKRIVVTSILMLETVILDWMGQIKLQLRAVSCNPSHLTPVVHALICSRCASEGGCRVAALFHIALQGIAPRTSKCQRFPVVPTSMYIRREAAQREYFQDKATIRWWIWTCRGKRLRPLSLLPPAVVCKWSPRYCTFSPKPDYSLAF